MRLRTLWPAIFVLVLALVACSPVPQLRDPNMLSDTSLISGEPCSAPCWNGIVPGETAWRDAVRIIQRDDRFANGEEREDDSGAVGYLWQTTNGASCCQMASRDGEVVSVILLALAPEMVLGDVIEKIGEPQYLIGQAVSDDQAYLTLVYPSLDTLLTVFVEGAGGALSETSEIISVFYLAERDMQDVLRTTPLYEWEGYQSFAYYNDGNYDVTPEAESAMEETPEPEATAEGSS